MDTVDIPILFTDIWGPVYHYPLSIAHNFQTLQALPLKASINQLEWYNYKQESLSQASSLNAIRGPEEVISLLEYISPHT